MPTLTRTHTTPDQFEFQPLGRSTLLNKIYIGFVKDTKDPQNMGRIRVYIPEIGGNAEEEHSWILCRYASPFAGATSIYRNNPGNNYNDSQQSYGMWFGVPDLENEVLVCFINGDPAKGVYFASLFQQNMNHMVPGIPGNNTTNSTPVGEYNKVKDDTNLASPTRPTYSPLADALDLQGLASDTIRGTSDSGARRPSNVSPSSTTLESSGVYGILTPGGSQLVFDDLPTNKFIRLRTQNGAQILIHDTTGEIYMITREGNSWFRMSNEGVVEIYAADDVSIRTEKSLNLRADLDVNIEAGRNLYIKARGDTEADVATDGGGQILMNANAAVHLSSFGDFFVSSMGEMHRTSDGSIYDFAKKDLHSKAGQTVHVQGDDGDIDMKAKGEIHETATNIHFNGVAPTDASGGTAAIAPAEFSIMDNQYVEGKRQTITRTSILYNMPYHEPYDHSSSVNTRSTNGKVQASTSDPDPNVRLVRNGEIVPGQQAPTDIIGTPKAGMDPGIYKGKTYQNGEPVYEKVGPISNDNSLNDPSYYNTSPSGVSYLSRKAEGMLWSISPDPKNQRVTFSVGYGHQLSKEELAGRYVTIKGEKVIVDKGITRAQATDLFAEDLKIYEQRVKRGIRVKITQTQFDALVSFAYNLGDVQGPKINLAKVINSGNWQEVPKEFERYTHDNTGAFVPSLLSRRRAEAQMFMTGVKPPTG
jgi:GH24 family phage-related lysozyme (muramidase)